MLGYFIVGAVCFVVGAALMFFARQGVVSESRRAAAAFHRSYTELIMEAQRVSMEAKADVAQVRGEISAHISSARNALAQDVAGTKQPEPPTPASTTAIGFSASAGSGNVSGK